MLILRRCKWWNWLFCLVFALPLFAEEVPSETEEDILEDEMDLTLEELFDIKVSVASKKEESISDAPGVIYVVSQDELQRIGATTLKDVLMRVPGMSVGNCSISNRSLPVMRGDLIKQNSSHILFLLNGRPIREILEGGINSDFIESFPTDVIEQIEVIRGPGSVLYGSDAFTGVINVITKKPTEDPLTFSLTGHYEPANGGGGMGTVMSKLGDVELVAAVRYYQKPDWEPEFLKKVQISYFDFTANELKYRSVDSVLCINIKDKGPGVFLDVNYKGLSATGTFVQWTTGAFQNPNLTVRGSKLFGNVGYKKELFDFWKTETNAGFTNAGLLSEDPSFNKRTSNNMLFENTHFITLFDNLNVVAGGTVFYMDGEELWTFPTNIGQPANLMSKGKRWAFSGYGQIDYTFFNTVKLLGGVQVNKTKNVEKHIAPRIGAIWRPVDLLSIKALYSEAFRLPSINELFMNFSGGLYGDTQLRPEVVKTTDVGISYQNDQMMVGCNVFYSRQMDIIQAVLIDSMARRYSNLGKFTFTGGELEGKWYFTKELYINGSVMYQKNFMEDSNGKHYHEVPSSNLLVKGGISYAYPGGITLSLFNTYKGDVHEKYKGILNNSQYSNNEFDHVDNGPFNLLGFSSQFALSKLFHWKNALEPSILFKVDNIIGKEIWIYEHGGFSQDIFPTIRGREFYLGVNVTM